MNQILISEKVYVTAEMRRKRKVYKTMYVLSLLVIVVLLTYYVLAERARNEQELVGQELLSLIEQEEDSTVALNPLVISLDEDEDTDITLTNEEVIEVSETPTTETKTSRVSASNGSTYDSEAIFEYPKLGIKYSILTEENDDLLKVSLCKFWGPSPNSIGNYVIVGHNYKSGKMFGKLSSAAIGDTVTLKDYSGTQIVYQVYSTYVVDPDDLSCTSQLTNGKRELTLITCTNFGQQRFVVKCKEI